MKKGILKIILKDFFKLRYVIIWILVVVLVGIGVVWAAWTPLGGYSTSPGRSKYINPSFGPCAVVNNNGISSYFIPVKSKVEWDAFRTAVGNQLKNWPASISLSACPPTCTPSCPSGAQCGLDGCGGSCGTCATGYTCSDHTCVDNTCVPTSPSVCSPGKCAGTDSCGNACHAVCPVNEHCGLKFCEPNP